MSLSNTTETNLLKLIFQNIDFPLIGDAPGLQNSAAEGSLGVALHVSDPGETGTQATGEATYSGYVRQAVGRAAAGWTVSGSQATNAATISFPQCGAGGCTATYFSVGTSPTGGSDSVILYSGQLASSLAISSGITPSFAAGALACTLD